MFDCICSQYLRGLARATLFILGLLASALSHAQSLHIAPAPDWVVARPVPNPSDALGMNGEAMLLLDRQVHLHEGMHRYQRVVRQIRDANGLEIASTLSIDFDPSYQQLTFHHLRILRGSQSLDLLSPERFEFLRRETELERSLYNGTVTAHRVLEDLRVGDVLDYSFTISGANPVFGDRFTYYAPTGWGVPVEALYIRISAPAQRPLRLTPFNMPAPALQREAQQTLIEYQAQHVPAYTLDSEAPSWFDPYPGFMVSDFTSWAEVVDWALPLYRLPTPSAPDVTALAASLRRDHATPDAQLIAALDFVQTQIRYVGIEVGEGSHRPTAPHITLARRYGDCKDKTVLLMALLRELGIRSDPLLVNTDRREHLDTLPPTPGAFDHVIVQVELNGQTYWLDPTRTHERGDLHTRPASLLGRGLRVRAGETALISAPTRSAPAQPSVHVQQQLTLAPVVDHTAEMSVQTLYRGLDAERMRGRLATSSLDALEKDYLNYYLRYYRGAQITQSPRLEQQNPDNWLKIHEQYQLRDLWRLSKDEQSYTFWLASDALNNLAPKPEIRARTAPFAIPHPTHVVQDIEVHLIDEWAFEDEEHVVDSDWFEFRFQVRFTGETLNLHYAYRSKVDAVPADALDDYLKAVEQMRDRLDYGLMFPAPAAATTGSPPASEPIHSSLLLDSRGLKLGIVLAILMMLVYVTWEYLRDRRDEALLPPGRYYPVSPLKLYLLSLVTFGVYTVFWGYRNWRYIAMRDGRALWSFPRALFLNFTLYGLYMDARKSAEGTPALRMSVALIAVLSLAYLISTILMNAYWAGYWLFLMLGMLCLLPLACHIQRINEHESEPYRFNSRWRPRHVLLGLFGVLLFAGDAARALYWIPPDTALDGQQLPTHARLFMQRHQVLGPDERLHAFYAEGLLSYAEGGNGFTDDAVVSYWHDPYQQRLQVERARFADIAHLDVQPPSRLNAGLVNIRRHDGSTFTLALPAHTGDAHQFANQLRKYWVMHRKAKRREG